MPTPAETARILTRLTDETLPDVARKLGETLELLPETATGKAEEFLVAAWTEAHSEFLAMLEERSVENLPVQLQLGFLTHAVSALNVALPAGFPLIYIITHVIGAPIYMSGIYSRAALPAEFRNVSGRAIPVGYSENESGNPITRFNILPDPSFLALQ